MILIIYRTTVWVCADPSPGAILPSMPTASLRDALTQAANQARGDTKP
jgi:hypothetical protein